MLLGNDVLKGDQDSLKTKRESKPSEKNQNRSKLVLECQFSSVKGKSMED